MSKQSKISMDQEEKSTLEAFESAFENGELESIADVHSEIKRIQKIMKASAKKNKRVSLRMSEWDFYKAQEKALQEGLPYQTFLSSIIHKFLDNQFVERNKRS